MRAVVLQGPANTAPERIFGPFHSMIEAEQWATEHPRPDGYSVAQQLSGSDERDTDGDLSGAPMVGFIPVTDLSSARAFYEGTLGFAIVEESPFALVADACGNHLRITPVPDLRPQPFTIAGWEVDNLEEMIERLVGRGVSFIRYAGMEQRPSGAWATPNGNLVAWFTDPDGNTLSMTELVL